MTDAYQATLDPRAAPQGDALAARGSADPLDAAYDRNMAAIERSMAAEQQIAREQSGALAKPRAELAAMNRQPLPQPPQPRQMPAAPQARNEPGADETWLMAASVLGAIAGGLTRNHVTNALGAMTGALEGYQQGSKQRFEQQLQQWKAEGEKAREENQAANERYTQILQSRKMALDQKLQEIELTAAQYQDRAMMQLAQTRNLETMGRMILARGQQDAKMAQAAATMKEKYAQMEQRERLAQQQRETTLKAAEIRARGRGSSMSPEGIDLAVEQALAGNPNATRGMRAGSEDFANFKNRLAEVAKERGMSAQDMNRVQQLYQGDVSATRLVSNRVQALETIIRNTNALVPQALNASAAVSRSKFVPVNEAIQAYQRGTSNPQMTAFAVANLNLAEMWARAMKPTGVLDVGLQEIALRQLNTAQDDRSYRTAVNAIVEAIYREHRAAQEQRAGAPMERAQVPGAFVPPSVSGGTAPAGVKPAPSQGAPRPGLSGDMPVPSDWQELGIDAKTGQPIRFREISP